MIQFHTKELCQSFFGGVESVVSWTLRGWGLMPTPMLLLEALAPCEDEGEEPMFPWAEEEREASSRIGWILLGVLEVGVLTDAEQSPLCSWEEEGVFGEGGSGGAVNAEESLDGSSTRHKEGSLCWLSVAAHSYNHAQ